MFFCRGPALRAQPQQHESARRDKLKIGPVDWQSADPARKCEDFITDVCLRDGKHGEELHPVKRTVYFSMHNLVSLDMIFVSAERMLARAGALARFRPLGRTGWPRLSLSTRTRVLMPTTVLAVGALLAATSTSSDASLKGRDFRIEAWHARSCNWEASATVETIPILKLRLLLILSVWTAVNYIWHACPMADDNDVVVLPS